MPRACTFDMMSVVTRSRNTTPPTFGADRVFTYTLNVDGTDTSMTCSSTSVLNSNVSCSSSNSVAVAAGQLVTIHVTLAGVTPTPGGRMIVSLHCQ